MLLTNRVLDTKVNPIQFEIGKLISAAVISTQFRSLLLENPGKALSSGFAGENFQLTSEARVMVEAIHATTLAEFATQLNSCI